MYTYNVHVLITIKLSVCHNHDQTKPNHYLYTFKQYNQKNAPKTDPKTIVTILW